MFMWLLQMVRALMVYIAILGIHRLLALMDVRWVNAGPKKWGFNMPNCP